MEVSKAVAIELYYNCLECLNKLNADVDVLADITDALDAAGFTSEQLRQVRQNEA